VSAESRRLEELNREVADLRLRLELAEAVVAAIDRAEVDAFLVRRGGAHEVVVLSDVDRPYRLLIECMQQGAALVAADGTIHYSNRRLEALLNQDHQLPPGKRLQDLVLPADRDATEAAIARGCLDGTSVEVAARHESGVLAIELSLSPLLHDGRLACVVATDLTNRRAQERHREVLAQEQAARHAAEQRAALLRESDRRKDAFLATLAHELRNPMAPLQNGLMALQLGDLDEAAVIRTHAMLTRQMETLVRLVDDLLDLGRLTQGKIRLQRERLDARGAVTRALETCQPVLQERQHRATADLPGEPVHVDADPVRLTQVLINLINNAARYTPSGGEIVVSLRRAEREAVLCVRDTGIGIPAAMLGRIFEPFAQIESEDGSSGGLGIGLTLARSLVEMHGGRILAHSEGPGRGSEFSVRLPLAEAPAPRVVDMRPAPASTQRSRILVVDDNRDAAESLAVLLGHFGHEVRLQHHAPDVLRTAREFQPDVVLLDIGLPLMNGYEVAQALRQDAHCRDVFIIGLSGYASHEDRARAMRAGFDEHRAKPIDLGDLQELLARPRPARAERGSPPQRSQARQGERSAEA
jgi:signal transduction histidine kinase/FixJ family two-component response regulator